MGWDDVWLYDLGRGRGLGMGEDRKGKGGIRMGEEERW